MIKIKKRKHKFTLIKNEKNKNRTKFIFKTNKFVFKL